MNTEPVAAGPAPSAGGSLAAVPRLLRSDPVLAALIGAADATVAVPEAAQAVVAAALAAFTERTPLLVITATGLDAERLGDDLTCLIASDDAPAAPGAGSGPVVGALAGPVTVLPAWETLPFERVSPETETMGRRLAVLHALTGAPDPDLPPPPRVIVAPVRAVLQRLGPLEGTAPVVIRPGQQVDVRSSCPALVAMGYRREHQVEHRGEFAVRGGIVDVFPSTAEVPVRIDLWGDEVDRLTAFAVSDQRSSHDLARRHALRMPRARPHAGVRARPRRWWHAGPGARRSGSASPRASSSTAWSRGSRSSTTRRGSCPTSCRPGRRSCSSNRAASATAACSCSTRRPRWPRRSPPPGGPRSARRRASRACTCRSSAC